MKPASESIGKLVRFSKGELLFSQGENTQDLFIIKEGTVRIYKTEGEVQVDLATVGPGEVLGEVAALDGGVRSASVVAQTDTLAMVISSSRFAATLAKIPDWFQKIARILVQRLRESDEKIDNRVGSDKLNQAAALLELMTYSSAAVQDEECWTLQLKYVENDLVDILGIPLNEVPGVLEKLCARDLVSIDRRTLTIKNRAALQKMSDQIFSKSEDSPVV